MNIQISVVLWTVICFFVLLSILHNLLFTPMLSHLDKRKERILKAREKRKVDEGILEKLISNSRKMAKQLKERVRIETERKVSEEQVKNEVMLAKVKKEESEKMERYKLRLSEEKASLLSRIDEDSDYLAQIFVSGFVS
ncbi:MAG: hypothetical protein PHE51_00670 [Eubacteriales bacterium]|nr:hypothetical protein [Eubacteriales bacterium]